MNSFLINMLWGIPIYFGGAYLLHIANVTGWHWWAIYTLLFLTDITQYFRGLNKGREQGYDEGFSDAVNEHAKGNWE